MTLADGTVQAELYPRSGSGLISSLREADGLIEIHEETTAIHRGIPSAFSLSAVFGPDIARTDRAGRCVIGQIPAKMPVHIFCASMFFHLGEPYSPGYVHTMGAVSSRFLKCSEPRPDE
ncbi:hypothetical protein V6L77_18910 [Pannonibacter sp. Pt2-lr]